MNKEYIFRGIYNDIEQAEIQTLENNTDTTSNEPATDCSFEGLHFIAGYVGHECLKYHTGLGLPTSKIDQVVGISCGWIE